MTQHSRFDTDEGVRHDTSLASMARLKPAFRAGVTVTAASSSQVSDGAAAVLVMEAGRGMALRLRPWARLVGYSVAGVTPERMGIGCAEVLPGVLRQVGINLNDIELNEAFAQVSRQLGLDIDRVSGIAAPSPRATRWAASAPSPRCGFSTSRSGAAPVAVW